MKSEIIIKIFSIDEFLKKFILVLVVTSCSRTNHNNLIQSLRDLEPDSELELVEEYHVELKKIGTTTIRLLRVKNWADPGDFLKIEIVTKDKTLSYSNTDGWVKFDHNYPVSEQLQNMNELLSDKVLVMSNDKYSLLILFGWVYASEPGLCTIINLNTGELEFNDNKELTSVSTDKRKFTFSDQTSIECY